MADDIPSLILKQWLDVIIASLVYLINKSFESGMFPQNMETGKVTPLYKKKKDPFYLESYRPVVIPCGFSKTFEYALLDRLFSFLNKFEIISNNQHGFCIGKSTQSVMLSLYHQVTEYVEASALR